MSRPTLSSSLLIAGAAYALSLGALWARQNQILYRAPRKVFCEDAPQTLLSARGIEPAMRGWADGPGDAAECVVYFGGSSESVELRRDDLGQACPGMTRYFMPYRGFGPNQGMKISEAALKADGVRLFDEVARRHDRVHVVSRSLGTGVGLCVAARRPVEQLALITPYDSIAAVAGEKYRIVPAGRLLRDRFESWRDAGQVKSTPLVCLAGLDKVISPKRWAELKRHFTVSPIESIFAACDHSNIAQCPDLWTQIGQYLGAVPELQMQPVVVAATSTRRGARVR